MSQQFSRRDFFAWLASPLTRAANYVAASEQRVRNLRMLKQVEAQVNCARCRAPFLAEESETTCPACRDAEAKNRALMQSLYKHE